MAVEAAWQRSVQSRSAGGQLDLAKANQEAASSLWAAPPSLELSRRSDHGNESVGLRESEMGFSWPLLLPGQRSARGTAAQSELDVAENSRLLARLRIAGDVREAAWDLIARESEQKVADTQASSLQALADDVERRVKSGDLARADELAARAEHLAASAVATDARQRLQNALSHWRLLTGVEPLADANESAPDIAPARHPELDLAIAASESARNKLNLVRASRMDPPELSVRFRQETPGTGLPAQNSVAFGIRIPLGTSDRNLPREAAARGELEVARATEERLRERLGTEADVARAAVLSAEQQQRAEAVRAGLLRERARLFDKSFRAGDTSLPDLLRAATAAAQADAGLARQQAAVGLARARLQTTLGRLP
ncbi:MAG: TolC family protein [Betaproteobacteria bacterium]